MKKVSIFFIIGFTIVVCSSYTANALEENINIQASSQVTTDSCSKFTKNMRIFDGISNKKADSVKELQQALSDVGYLKIKPTGHFGLVTLNAVKRYQKDNKITATGFVGEATRNLLRGKYCSDISSHNLDNVKLSSKKWIWVKTMYTDKTTVTPKNVNAFGITFGTENHASISTDCNTMGGQFTVNKNNLSFGMLMSTKMYCEDSQENVFSSDISKIESYTYNSTTREMEFTLSNGGKMFFK